MKKLKADPTISQLPPSSYQEGVTLVIAIVMLASVTFISFSLSAIILREIVGSRLILKTEPAIGAANAGGEVGLYQLLRQTGNIATTGTFSNSSVGFQVKTNLFDVSYPFSIASGGQLRVALYDPTDPNNTAADYGSVTITNNSNVTSNPFKVEIFSFGNSSTHLCNTPVTVGTSQNITCNLVSADDRYLVIIQPTGNSAVSGFIQTTDNSGAPKGVPSATPKLEVTGSNGDVQRKIQIKLQ